MNNSMTKEIPPLTREQMRRLYELSKMPDEEIDYSDIPKITPEEWKKFLICFINFAFNFRIFKNVANAEMNNPFRLFCNRYQ